MAPPTQPPQERLESLKQWLGLPSEAEQAGGCEAERAGGAGRVGAIRRLRSEKRPVRPQSAAPCGERSEKRLARCESADVASLPGAFGERLRTEANSLRSQIETLRRNRDGLRGEIRKLHKEAAQLHNESLELREENVRAAMLREEATQLRTENADLRAEAAALRAEGASLRHENAKLRGEGVALLRSHELLQCERSMLSRSQAVANADGATIRDKRHKDEQIFGSEQEMSGGMYDMTYTRSRARPAEDSQDEMDLEPEVLVDCSHIQAGDPIAVGTFIEDGMEPPAFQFCEDLLGCPSPSRRAQRMRPGFADVTRKQHPVPPLTIPEFGEAVQGLYEECESESSDEEQNDEDAEQLQNLRQSLGFLQKSNVFVRNPQQTPGQEVPDMGETGAPGAALRDVLEPRGSSARPPRAKGSHSLEVGPLRQPSVRGWK